MIINAASSIIDFSATIFKSNFRSRHLIIGRKNLDLRIINGHVFIVTWKQAERTPYIDKYFLGSGSSRVELPTAEVKWVNFDHRILFNAPDFTTTNYLFKNINTMSFNCTGCLTQFEKKKKKSRFKV